MYHQTIKRNKNMNFEMIIKKCQEARRIEDALRWNKEFYKFNNQDLPQNNKDFILLTIHNLETDLMNCETVIKSLTI